MGKILVIKGANFSSVAVGKVDIYKPDEPSFVELDKSWSFGDDVWKKNCKARIYDLTGVSKVIVDNTEHELSNAQNIVSFLSSYSEAGVVVSPSFQSQKYYRLRKGGGGVNGIKRLEIDVVDDMKFMFLQIYDPSSGYPETYPNVLTFVMK